MSEPFTTDELRLLLAAMDIAVKTGGLEAAKQLISLADKVQAMANAEKE